jgi:transcriptional regulator with XRE-family HTH domain
MAERISTPAGAKLLGQRIASMRKGSGKSQVRLGKDAGVERSLISKLEGGHFKTLNGSVQKVCTTLGLDPLDPAADQHVEAVIRRITALAARSPRLLEAVDKVLDILESITTDKGGRSSR